MSKQTVLLSTSCTSIQFLLLSYLTVDGHALLQPGRALLLQLTVSVDLGNGLERTGLAFLCFAFF